MDITNKLIKIQKQGYSLIISPSRRTPEFAINIFKDKFQNNQNIYFWDRKGHNPYFAILNSCDILMVTCDSISMASEVISTDKPVYFLNLPGGSR